MTDQDMRRDDPNWEGFMAEVVGDVGRQARERKHMPEFAEVVARARRLDPAAVSLEQVQDAADAGASRIPPMGNGSASAEQDRLRTPPRGKLREAGATDPSTDDDDVLVTFRPRRYHTAAWTLVAAACLLVVGWSVRAGLTEQLSLSDPARMSPHVAEGDEARGATTVRRAGLSGRGGATSDDSRPEFRAVPAEELAIDPMREVEPGSERAVDPDSDHKAETKRRSRKARRSAQRSRPRVNTGRPSLDERLADLDARAQQSWREGDRGESEKLFREIVRLGRGTQWAQLAYGDMFALRRQRSDKDGEARLWLEYIGAFPHGIHADEARAGLCRRAPDHDSQACWRRYLDDFPRGSYRAQALRTLDREEQR